MTTNQKTFTDHDLATNIEAFNTLQETHSEQFIEDFQQQQPRILAYLVANGETLSDDPSVAEELLLIGAFVWNLYQQHFPQLPMVSETTLFEAEAYYLQRIEALEKLPSEQMTEAMQRFVENPYQPVLGHFVQTELVQNLPGQAFGALSVISILIRAFENSL